MATMAAAEVGGVGAGKENHGKVLVGFFLFPMFYDLYS